MRWPWPNRAETEFELYSLRHFLAHEVKERHKLEREVRLLNAQVDVQQSQIEHLGELVMATRRPALAFTVEQAVRLESAVAAGLLDPRNAVRLTKVSTA